MKLVTDNSKIGLIVFLLLIGLISVWMNWEAVRTSMDWSKHSQSFPLPFYLASPPIYFYIDLSYLLIIIVLGVLAYFSLKGSK
ncbi:MAG: hypothetical protein QXI27_06075 [Nitrososphaerota archaeon]